MSDHKLSGYTRGIINHRWIRMVTLKAGDLNRYLSQLPEDVLILSVAPVTIQGQAYRRCTLDIEKYERRDSSTRYAEGFDFRKMLRDKPIRPRN